MSKLEELQKIANEYLLRRGSHHRCSICNSVSDESIETEVGDYKSGVSFVNDPKNPMHFICTPCSESIRDTLDEYDYESD